MTNGSEPKVDNLQETQDYSQFRRLAKEVAESQHFELLEILTNKIHSSINDNKFVIGSKVNICKPSIFDDCKVAYELSNI
jgi:dihydroneopterin aldolase